MLVDNLLKNKKYILYLIAAVVVVALLWYIKKKADQRAVEKLAAGETSTNSWIQKENELSAEEKWQIIEAIHEAVSGVGTDENAVYNALRNIKTKTNFNIINDVYRTKYKENIIDVLEDELSEWGGEIDKARQILNDLK